MSDHSQDTKRVAKNTLMLYARMFLLMFIGLFTSRVILASLGVEDFGIYNVVGGFVAMFAIIYGSLSNAISRFLQVELGRGDKARLNVVFSTAVNVQILMAIVVVLIAEAFGLWFLHHKMNIPPGRESAAVWAFHTSVVSMAVNIISIPYNAAIISHEKMSAFAYISLLEAVFKLLVAYSVFVTPFDGLKTYAVLLLIVAIILRYVYAYYCKKHFEECTYRPVFDKSLLKEMSGFAGWNFLGNSAMYLNNQGVNLLMNVFFGVVVNAARGVAMQVNNAVQQFITNFMTAMVPQITKSYAAGDKQYAFKLTCMGSKFSFFLMFVFALPIILETDELLVLWLKTPPDGTAPFLRWTLAASLTTVIANTMFNLQMAHGNIRKYQIVCTAVGILPFPLSWLCFSIGMPPVTTFIVAFVVSFVQIFVRFSIVSPATGFPFKDYILGVVIRGFATAAVAAVIPLFVATIMDESLLRFCVNVPVSVFCSLVAIYFVGLSGEERGTVNSLVLKLLRKIGLKK